jgi:phenylacetic acid degradation operon negative regulatory protein
LTAVDLETTLPGMQWATFHHPDISFPVVKRRVATELLELLDVASVFLSRGGWAVLNRSCYPNRKHFRDATYRLRDKGLLVHQREGGLTPILTLTEAGESNLPAYFNPEKAWNRKWNGIWYLFVYDVPETDRKYRNVLRQFLKRMKLGCLQQSVWITPVDIRPDFDDLMKGASVDAFAYLFESRTVLGLPNRRVVEGAWDFEQLENIQTHYCNVMEANIARLADVKAGAEDLAALMRLSLDGLHAAFTEDPLLPKTLWPHGYEGERAIGLHRTLFKEIGKKLPDA